MRTHVAYLCDVFTSPVELHAALAHGRYYARQQTAARAFEALRTGRPLLILGPQGCGKSSLGTALAAALGSRLVRLDCELATTPESAIYRWDTPRQLAAVDAATTAGHDPATIEREIASEDYLLKGPLLDALTSARHPVTLLVTGLDAASAGLMTLLAGFLQDYAVEVPQVGRFEAEARPLVVLTASAEAPGMDAVARSCAKLMLEYPAFDDELAAVMAALPAAPHGLAAQACNVVQQLRREGLSRPPGIGDTIAWTRRLASLGLSQLDNEALMATADTILPLLNDRERIGGSALIALVRPHLDRTG